MWDDIEEVLLVCFEVRDSIKVLLKAGPACPSETDTEASAEELMSFVQGSGSGRDLLQGSGGGGSMSQGDWAGWAHGVHPIILSTLAYVSNFPLKKVKKYFSRPIFLNPDQTCSWVLEKPFMRTQKDIYHHRLVTRGGGLCTSGLLARL